MWLPKPPPDLGEPLGEIPLQPAVARLVVVLLDPKVVLRRDPIGGVVGILVALAVTEPLGAGVVLVLEMPRHGDHRLLADVTAGRGNRRRAGVALGRKRQIDDRLCECELALRQADELGEAAGFTLQRPNRE